MNDVVKAMGMSGVSKSQVSRLCGATNWPYLWIELTLPTSKPASRAHRQRGRHNRGGRQHQRRGRLPQRLLDHEPGWRHDVVGERRKGVQPQVYAA